MLWPSQQKVDIPLPFQNAAGGAVMTAAGRVLSSGPGYCGSPSAGKVLTAAPAAGPHGPARCTQALTAIDSGPNTGAATLLEFGEGPGQPTLAAGEDVRLIRQVDEQDMTHYAFYHYERTWSLRTWAGCPSITGLLLAGFIIGSLGVLNDVTVTQASTVFELANLGESHSRRAIFVGAMRVGRDHIASTVYTLVLAYAGSALPLLLLFSVANRSLGDVLTSESVAIEIVRSAVGGNFGRAGHAGAADGQFARE
ncbi:YibE/F family protein [Candidatus Mycobacterium methanotrophicum]|uniref:YibE/F family protein n=1 Tax=Candidatus Mycobacterium methanotrophicum TaxID=2943498 RepID=UPI00210513D8|nr:YibE/F family protein [Candidatus Mycobacterium methanotrophicum]